MTFQTSLRRHMHKRRLARRMALLKSARKTLMTAASVSTGQRADALADLAAYADVVAAFLWPLWRGM